MSASNPDWSEMWVWRASTRRADRARMAILTAEHLYVTGPLDRRRIADLHEAARLGSDHIDAVLKATSSADESMRINRSDITWVSWHRTTRVIEVGRAGFVVPLELHCAESESTEEIGRGLQRSLGPLQLPISAPVDRRQMIKFELLQGKGRLPLQVLAVSIAVALVAFMFGALWIGAAGLAVAAVALVGVASVIRDADLSVPRYRVDFEQTDRPDDDNTDDVPPDNNEQADDASQLDLRDGHEGRDEHPAERAD